jgi:GNAT superfamily N-acetyltransferase
VNDCGPVTTTASVLLDVGKAKVSDLGVINVLIDSAIGTWKLSDRVKRTSRPLYHYHEQDLEFLELVVARTQDDSIVGVATWEAADQFDAPPGYSALLLHGIYVAPDLHHRGIGTQLLESAELALVSGGFDGLLVRAQSDAEPFFKARGFAKLPVINPLRDYPHRYWKKI